MSFEETNTSVEGVAAFAVAGISPALIKGAVVENISKFDGVSAPVPGMSRAQQFDI